MNFNEQINDLKLLVENFDNYKNDIKSLFNIALSTLINEKKIIFCGNGGSAAEAQHLSAELIGRFKHDRKSLASISLTVDTSAITSIGNDYGYEKIFERQVEGIGKKGDLIIFLSTSGNSKNLILAAKKCKEIDISTAGLLGNGGGILKEDIQYPIIIDSNKTDRIQELHLFIGHLLCEHLEKNYFNL